MAKSQQTGEFAEWKQTREIILERGDFRCSSCYRPEDTVESLDVHHVVPRGAGGPERFSNYALLCRQCHEAAERDAVAPGIEFQTTGQMDEYTFIRFRHFFQEIVPAMAKAAGFEIKPRFGLHEKRDFWHISLGDIRLADAVLASELEGYNSLRAVDYM
jgi:hypothetical protein